MDQRAEKLLDAQQKAEHLFAVAKDRGYIASGQMEKDLNTKMYDLALELYGIRKYWHKRIVRVGANTLLPYRENPPNLPITADDILFFDFGPVFEDWEADVGRTYVLGDDSAKHKLSTDIVAGWHEGRAYFRDHPNITGSELYAFSSAMARRYGWEYGGPHCGHLIGNFPHEKILGEEVENYIHPDNHQRMADPDRHGTFRHWIYEIHFVDRARQMGGFFEQLLTVDLNEGGH
jgi:Xaa-Pro dipeptidase